jgi:hypothetical protein
MRGNVHAGRVGKVRFLARDLCPRTCEKPIYCAGAESKIVDGLPAKLPPITLRHGQVIWLLVELGHSAGVSEQTFYEYIKSLRKVGIPFAYGTMKSRDKTLAAYRYCEVMELAMTLALRVYHVVPDSVLKAIVRNRARLHRLYRRAYAERMSGKGSPVFLATQKGAPIGLRGCFLDLGIRFSGGQLINFGPPKLLSPEDALALSARRMLSVQTSLPLGLSALAEQVVALALAAPRIRRGSPRQTMARGGRKKYSNSP